VQVLDAIAVQAGAIRLSALLVVQATLWLALLLWAATLLVNVVDRRLQTVTDLSPSGRVLIGKLLRFGAIALAVVMALNAVGVDMTALAVFSGALGLGIGIGLQRVVANLLSGVFLLMDRSVKPGDVIEVEGTFGWVVSMQARFVSLVTRDRKEILIPNEDFITNRVVNWSHSDNLVRLEVPFSVSYQADPHRIRALAVEAAAQPSRVVDKPAPVCHLTAFGDNGLEFILRFWIEDAPSGVANVTGQVLLALWDAFKAEGVDIPFPHRDIKMRDPVRVVMDRPGPAP
jgi:small-conductance mechanosensitive channel